MTRQFTNGYEAGDFTTDGWTVSSGTPAYVTSGQRTGSRALEANGLNEFVRRDISSLSIAGRHFYYRQAIKVVTEPQVLTTVMGFWSATQAERYRIQYDPASNTLQMWTSSAHIGDSLPISTGTWYIVELRCMIDNAAGGFDYGEARLNGTVFALESGFDRHANLAGYIYAGQGAGTTPGVFLFDDAALNDDQGATDNSYPGTPVAPTTNLVSTPPNPDTDTTPTFSFNGTSTEGGPTFEGRMDGGSYATVASPYTAPTLSTGSHTFDVRAVDTLAQVDATPSSYTWTLNAGSSSFPTTSVKDDFNRADESPVSKAGAWQGRATTSGEVDMKVLGTKLALAGPDTTTFLFGSAIYNETVQDGEVYATVTAWNQHLIRLYIRMAETGGPNTHDGYVAQIANGVWQIDKVTDGIHTTLGTTFSQAVALGDSVGLQAVGTSINAYHKPAAGSWTQIATRTDATYTTGKIGIGTNSPSIRFDDFGGGNTTVGGAGGGTSALLDNFNRVNGAIGANWAGNTTKWAINTNQLAQTSITAPTAITWVTPFGPAAEVYIDIPTKVTSMHNGLTLDLGAGNSYDLNINYVDGSHDSLSLTRYDGGVGTSLLANILVNQYPTYVLAAHSDGKMVIYGASGGTRTNLVEAVDNTHRGSFTLGVYGDNTGIRLDNFGGGRIGASVPPTGTNRRNRILVGGSWTSKPVMVLINGFWVEKPEQIPGAEVPPPTPEPTPIPVDAVAKFHRSAFGSTQTPSNTTSASRTVIMLLAGWWMESTIPSIKAANPNVKVLCYVNMTRIYTGGASLPYGNAIWGRAQRPQYDSGIVDADSGGNIAKIDVAGYGADAVTTLTSRFGSTLWDGILLDDMNAISDGYGTDAAWRTTMQNVNSVVGPGLKANMPNKLFMPNMSGDAGQYDLQTGGWVETQWNYYDGGLDEFWATWPGAANRPQNLMDHSFGLLGRIAAKNKYYLVDSIGNESQALFAMCGCLMQTQGKVTFYSTANNLYNSEQWFANVHDRARQLGKATGAKFTIGTNNWRRNFERGYATCNVSSRVGQIVILQDSNDQYWYLRR